MVKNNVIMYSSVLNTVQYDKIWHFLNKNTKHVHEIEVSGLI